MAVVIWGLHSYRNELGEPRHRTLACLVKNKGSGLYI